MKEIKYKLKRRIGKYRQGQIVSNKDPYIRRKLQEDKNDFEELKLESKKIKKEHSNKMLDIDFDNKGGK